ncbi:MAG: lipopolysaccharide biosynthesis protein [Alphaproteobacteria bacterium]
MMRPGLLDKYSGPGTTKGLGSLVGAMLRSGGIRIAGLLAGYAFYGLISNAFGAAGLGRFTLAMTVLLMLGTLAVQGFVPTVVRFTAGDLAQNRADKARARARWALGRVGIAALVLAAVLFLVAERLAIAVFADPALTPVLQIISLGLIAQPLILLLAAYAQGCGRVALAMAIQYLGPPALAAGLLLGPLGLAGPESVGAMAQAGALWITLLVGAALVPDLWHGDTQLPANDRQAMVTMARPLLLSSAAGLLLGWADTLMLGMLSDPAQVGLYAVAFRFALLTSLGQQVVNATAGPRIAGAFSAGDHGAVQAILGRSVMLGALGAAPFVAATLLFAEPLLALFGPDFAQGGTLVRIIVLGEFAALCLGPGGTTMNMTGLEQLFRNVVLSALIVNILLNLILIPLYGALGAAIATALTAIGQKAVMALILYRIHGFVTPLVPRSMVRVLTRP